MKERCNVCHQFKTIFKRLRGAPANGSMMKHRPMVLVCKECDEANTRNYDASQQRWAKEQIAMIEGVIAEYPEMKERLTPTLNEWKVKAGLSI